MTAGQKTASLSVKKILIESTDPMSNKKPTVTYSVEHLQRLPGTTFRDELLKYFKQALSVVDINSGDPLFHVFDQLKLPVCVKCGRQVNRQTCQQDKCGLQLEFLLHYQQQVNTEHVYKMYTLVRPILEYTQRLTTYLHVLSTSEVRKSLFPQKQRLFLETMYHMLPELESYLLLFRRIHKALIFVMSIWQDQSNSLFPEAEVVLDTPMVVTDMERLWQTIRQFMHNERPAEEVLPLNMTWLKLPPE